MNKRRVIVVNVFAFLEFVATALARTQFAIHIEIQRTYGVVYHGGGVGFHRCNDRVTVHGVVQRRRTVAPNFFFLGFEYNKFWLPPLAWSVVVVGALR